MMTPFLRALGILVALLPDIGQAANFDIDQLMRNMAQSRSGHASFIEKKYIAMLDQPVESSGELYYSAPDHLEKRTIRPKPESMTVDGNTLIIARGRQKHHLQLQDYPELAAFIDSIRGTLSGDRKALEKNYRLVLEGAAERWVLTLLPSDEKAAVKRISITGAYNTVRSIEITQADGDSSLMLIETLAAP